MHAFPFAFVETVLFYNRYAFDEAGIAYPDEGWTWAHFLDAAQKLTLDENGDGTTDQYGFWLYGRYAHVEPWVYQNGGRLLNESKTRFEPDEQALEALAFRRFADSRTPGCARTKRDGGNSPTGCVWTGFGGHVDRRRLEYRQQPRSSGRRVQLGDCAPAKRTSGRERHGLGWPDSLSVATTCEHPDEAWELIQFMTGPDRTIDLTFAGKIPIYKSVALADEFLEAGQQPDNKAFLLEWADHTGPTTFTPGWGEWRGYTDGAGMEGQLDDVFNGVTDLDTALQNITEHANSVLERYYP